MKFRNIVLLSILCQPTYVLAKNSLRNKNNGNGNNFSDTDCRAFLQDTQFGDGHTEEKFACELSDGTMADIVGQGADELKQMKKENKFKSGRTIVSKCEFKGNKGGFRECYLPPGLQTREDSAEDTDRRKLLSGTKTVLIVKVKASDTSLSETEQQLSDSIFGNGRDPHNLQSQYKACSHDKLNFIPTDFGGIQLGATTVTISNTASGSDNGVIRNAATSELSKQFGVPASSLADYVMLCLPPGTNGGWIAYAYINYYLSVYNNQWCTYLSAQMHEIGHNINLAHSGEGSGEYADQSGMMGYSYSSNDGPLMCFNGAKSWQLGWYADKSLTLVPSDGQWSGRIYGAVDYESISETSYVLIKIDNPDGSPDYYIQFNRKTGFNSGTVEGGNQVMITSGGEGNSYATSSLLSKLNNGGS